MKNLDKPIQAAAILWITSVPLYLYISMPWWFYPVSLFLLVMAMYFWNYLLSPREGEPDLAAQRKKRYALVLSAIFAVTIISCGVILFL
ncbi:hypothetical protein L1O03_11405 [Corynebacterium uropygiale]|uniref:Uncharacterized protein n=1 Tax=Corynebacterium uropygiale TaxID=1775911 RepID=A0A9X1QS58_9CORY|nr:hypothetical protein [Corynebacterium uropygiale]MCF4007771.1 hypothetical protein [Corynebacterium uropygiale]